MHSRAVKKSKNTLTIYAHLVSWWFVKSVSTSSSHAINRDVSTHAWLNLLRDAVEAVDFGTIQIKVHGGEVVQIETTRKIRVPSSLPPEPSLSSLRPTAHAEVQHPKHQA